MYISRPRLLKSVICSTSVRGISSTVTNNIRVHRHHLECRQIEELLYSVRVIYLSLIYQPTTCFIRISQKYFTRTRRTQVRYLCHWDDFVNHTTGSITAHITQCIPPLRLFHEFVTACRVNRQTDSRANAPEWMNESLSIDCTENCLRQQP